jgi:hypothetical protein
MTPVGESFGSMTSTPNFTCISTNNSFRSSFEKTELVCVPTKGTWHAISTCLWADDKVKFPQMASIKSSYTGLEDFFCRILGVPKPNLGMHVQALKQLSLIRPLDGLQLKQSMLLISSMDPSPEDVNDLKNANIFEVKPAKGPKTYTNSAADFAIIDRSEYGTAFKGKINLLNFKIGEARACRSLLFALGLKGRHLSETVEETTSVKGGVIDKILTHQSRSKAYALLRYVSSFRHGSF